MTVRYSLLLLVGILCCFNFAFAGTYEQELAKLSADLGTSLDGQHLKTVAVISFKDIDGNETKLGKLLVEDISVDLVDGNKGVSVIDRANLNRIMDEQKLTEEGLVTPENAKKLKLSGIDAIIIGTIIPFEDTYRVDVKAIATDTAQLVVAKRANITKTDDLDALMGIKKVEKVSTESATAPAVGGVDSPLSATPAKQKEYDFGWASVKINSVEFFRKAAKIRVSYSVTNRHQSGYGYGFAYHLINKNAPISGPGTYNPPSAFNRPPDIQFAAGASDDQGNAYKVLMPSDANSTPHLEQNQSIELEVEYKIDANGASTYTVPNTANFWLEFYVGEVMYTRDPATLIKLSVANYAFDKMH